MILTLPKCENYTSRHGRDGEIWNWNFPKFNRSAIGPPVY